MIGCSCWGGGGYGY
nr:hypothetical protein [Bacillus cereus]